MVTLFHVHSLDVFPEQVQVFAILRLNQWFPTLPRQITQLRHWSLQLQKNS